MTMTELKVRFSDEQIADFANRWLEHKYQQAEYHAKYNQRKNAETKKLMQDPAVQAALAKIRAGK
jgi:hypothetical protein